MNQKNKKHLQVIIKLALCWAVTFVIAFLTFNVFRLANTDYSFDDWEKVLFNSQEISIDEIYLDGYEINADGTIVAVRDDPNMYLPELNQDVINMELVFDGEPDQALSIVCFYNEEGDGYSPEFCVQSRVDTTDSVTCIEFDEYVHKMRIDIGDFTGDSFELESIKTNVYFKYSNDITYLWIVLFCVMVCFVFSDTKIMQVAYKYRYLIAAGMCVIGIAFEFNGSSIGYWAEGLFGSGVYETFPDTIFGVNRGIRGDDWAINTSMAISQYYNDFAYKSTLVGTNPMDMFIVYGQPVWDISVIFRPSHWGYLLLGPSRGLSYFWIMRAVALFMISWEFGKLICCGNKKLGATYAFAILFSPLVQWWFSINGLVEMLLFSQAIVLLFNRYISTDLIKKRVVYMAGIFYCGWCFGLTFYPSWMVPVIYVMICMCIGLLVAVSKNPFHKYDFIIIIGNACVFIPLLVRIIYMSWDAITLTMNTVYPGARFDHGGGYSSYLFTSMSNIFSAYSEEIFDVSNVCEEASFVDLAPVGILLGIYVIVRKYIEKEKQDRFLITMVLMSFFMMFWGYFGLNDLFSKLSLTYLVMPARGYPFINMMQLIILFRVLATNEYNIDVYKSAIVSFCLTMSCLILTIVKYPSFDTSLRVLVTFAIMFVLFYLVIRNGTCVKSLEELPEKAFVMIFATLMICGGLFVNPLNRGIDAIRDNKLLQEVKNIDDSTDYTEVWVFEGSHAYMGTSLLTVGVKSLNAIHVYPDFDMWHTIDPNGDYEDVYNRYQHIIVNVENGDESSFEVGDLRDTVVVNMTLSDMKKMGVTNVITRKNLEDYEKEDANCELISNIGEFGIYQIN